MIHWETKLQEWCEKIGASHGGVAALESPLSWDHYERWLSLGYHGEMDYLSEHAEFKRDPSLWRPDFHSALVMAFPYRPHPFPFPQPVLTGVRTALYSQGYDYHYWVKGRLAVVLEELRSLFPGETFEIHTDSSPLLERDLAYRAGLGWYGKNSCLIDPEHGSLFLIGEILTSLRFDRATALTRDACGTCTRCLDVCPTGALKSPKVVDASRCISYLTIESREIPSKELRPLMKDWFFGCDLCQTVCPWNQKVFRNELRALQSGGGTRLDAGFRNRRERDLNTDDFLASDENLISDLRWLLQTTNNQILKRVRGTPYYRAGAKGLKRNALIVIANRKMTEFRSDILPLVKDPYLGELAQWCLEQLG